MTIREIAKLTVTPDQADNFFSAASACRPIFEAADGFISFSLERSLEQHNVFFLLVEWETVEHHTEIFRKSLGYDEWRSRVGHLFAIPPEVSHTTSGR